jgi:hypothetical protein
LSMWSCLWKFKTFLFGLSNIPTSQNYMIDNINRVTTCYTLDIEFLTCGNDNLTYEQNCIIFKYVFYYIKCSKRFLIV